MRKGISPLIATVLIIGLVIVIATIVMLFGTEFVKKSTQRVDVQTEEKTVCLEDVSFEIRSACYLNPSRLRVLVLNTGKTDIRKFYARFYKDPNTVSEVEKKQVVKASSSATLDFDVSEIKQVELFPSVRHKFKTLVCSINTISYGDSFRDTSLDPCTS